MLRASNFRTPVRPTGFENFNDQLAEVAVYLARSTPDKQTFEASVGMSQMCHFRTHAPQQLPSHSIASSAVESSDGRCSDVATNRQPPSRPLSLLQDAGRAVAEVAYAKAPRNVPDEPGVTFVLST